MGMTLPLLVKGVMRWDPDFAGVLGRLYGWNTLGAVGGALAVEMLLVERFGIRGAAFVALIFNFVAAAAAHWLSRRAAEDADGATPLMGIPESVRRPLSCSAKRTL